MTNLVWRWLSHLYWTRGSKSILQMAIILRRTFHLHLFCWPKGLHFKDVDWDVFEHTLMKIVSNEAKEVIKAAMIELHPEKATYMLGTYYVQSVHKWIHQMWIDQSVQDWQKTQRIIAKQKYPLPRGFESTTRSSFDWRNWSMVLTWQEAIPTFSYVVPYGYSKLIQSKVSWITTVGLPNSKPTSWNNVSVK